MLVFMSDCVSVWQSELQREVEHKNSMLQELMNRDLQQVSTISKTDSILSFGFHVQSAPGNSYKDIHYIVDFFFFRFPLAQKTMDILTLEIQLPLCQV